MLKQERLVSYKVGKEAIPEQTSEGSEGCSRQVEQQVQNPQGRLCLASSCLRKCTETSQAKEQEKGRDLAGGLASQGVQAILKTGSDSRGDMESVEGLSRRVKRFDLHFNKIPLAASWRIGCGGLRGKGRIRETS